MDAYTSVPLNVFCSASQVVAGRESQYEGLAELFTANKIIVLGI